MTIRLRSSVVLSAAFLSLAGLGACKTVQPAGSMVKGDEAQVLSAITGCHEVVSVAIATSATPTHPAITSVKRGKTVCIEDTLRPDGSISRSGRVSVTVKDGGDDVVGGTWGFDVAEDQPRCIGCYSLAGFDGSLEWDGEQNAADASQPVVLTVTARPLETTYKIAVKKSGGGAGPADSVVKGVAGCHAVKSVKIVTSATPTHPAITSVKNGKTLCFEDTLGADGSVSRSGRVSVTVKNASGAVVGGTWGFDVSEAQPRCPGCYLLAGFDGSVDWNGEAHGMTPSVPVKVTAKINGLQTTYEFQVEPAGGGEGGGEGGDTDGGISLADATRIVNAVKGCRRITGVKVDSSTPSHPAIVSVTNGKKLCFEDSLRPDGSMSRSGRVVATVLNASGATVGGAWGFDVAADQPRCMGCYTLSGFDGRVDYDGEQHQANPSVPVTVTIKANSLDSTFTFTVK